LRTVAFGLSTLSLLASVAGAVPAPVPVADIRPGVESSRPSNAVDLDGVILFAADDGVTGTELWRTDGTVAGTRLVKDIDPGVAGSNPAQLTKVGASVFFVAGDRVAGRELWKTDGTRAVRVKDIAPGFAGASVEYLTPIGDTVFFKACAPMPFGCEVWKSDGTEAGTIAVADIRPGPAPSNPRHLTAVGRTLFFSADDGRRGTELWKSDGTPRGTVLVADLDPRRVAPGEIGHSSPANLTVAGGRLYFSAQTAAYGRELWKTDGTAAGTTLVRDLSAGRESTQFTDTADVDGRLFFTAVVSRPVVPPQRTVSLWRTDGTATSTFEIRSASDARELTAGSGTLFFTARAGRQLWKVDRNAAQATRLAEPAGGAIQSLLFAAGRLFFSADDGNTGGELWASDGTVAGTALVSDVNPGPAASKATPLVASARALFLSADGGSEGVEPWTLPFASTTDPDDGDEPETFKLTVDVSGTDGGSGIVDVAGAPVPGPCFNGAGESRRCEYEIAAGTAVRLLPFAPPDSMSVFVEWTEMGPGAPCHGNGACDLVMNADHVAAATFKGPQLLRVSLIGRDNGRGIVDVTGAPVPGPCIGTPEGHSCDYRFTPGTAVRLLASAPPDSMSIFTGWDDLGPDSPCHGTGACDIVMDTHHWVSAEFKGPQQLSIALSQIDGGWGIVDVTGAPVPGPCISTPQGQVCQYEFRPGTAVRLLPFAPPDAMSVFSGWEDSGSPCHGTGACDVVMDTHHVVMGRFKGPQILNVDMSYSTDGGWGIVDISGAPVPGPCRGIPNQPQQCQYRFTPGTAVRLLPFATPDSMSVFTGWAEFFGGPCRGTGACDVVMDTHHFAGAMFKGPQLLGVELSSIDGGWGIVDVTGANMPCSNTSGATNRCEYRFTPGTAVTLQPLAPPEAQSVFEGWEELGPASPCHGVGPCTLVLNEPVLVRGAFKGSGAGSTP
jgi:ELWxxDGT repeat protein